MSKPSKFPAVIRQVPEGHIGFADELPGTNTQGVTSKKQEGILLKQSN